jgi:type IV secretory pathway VirB10-like protein
MSDALATPSPKLDPETLAIRARPPRTIRFKRGAIIAIAAVGSTSLVAVTWMALSPHMLRHGQQPSEMSQPDARPTTDVLNGAPATYGDVPRLGPPLPGDLGKPILEHQQALVAAANPADQQAQQAEAVERERQLAELKAARESGLLIQGRQSQGATDVAAPTATAAPAAADGAKVTLDPEHDPNEQSRKAAFVSTLDSKGDVNPHSLTPLPSPFTLSAGSVISASLITGLRSDLPGLVTAQITENVYDSATGRLLLVPQGARLIGAYDSVVAFGQSRALIVWQRIVMPDGSSLRLDNVPATDPSGYAGLADKVDFHTWRLLKGVAISTLLGIGADLQFTGNGGLIDAIRQSGEQNVTRAGDQLTSKTLNIQPTITIRPGAPVRLVVNKDLVLAPIEWAD